MAKYCEKMLAPIQQRSIFLPIGPGGCTIDNTSTREDLDYSVPSESDEDHFDAMQPPKEMLEVSKVWWFLEFWPVKVRVLSRDKEGWKKMVRANLSRYREIPGRQHWTVQKMIDVGQYSLQVQQINGTKWRQIVQYGSIKIYLSYLVSLRLVMELYFITRTLEW
ncbi:hypothetical protein F4803DRAFT_540973 [Xylaria telfairii]|nr:hypothetical protein F4803DRAFT_540973 [Xylaria telfairii]